MLVCPEMVSVTSDLMLHERPLAFNCFTIHIYREGNIHVYTCVCGCLVCKPIAMQLALLFIYLSPSSCCILAGNGVSRSQT